MTPTYSSWLANDPHNLGGNYAYAWYEGSVDLSKLPNGSYKVYHEVTVNGYTQREELKFYNDLSKKIVNTTQYSFTKYNGSSLMIKKEKSSTREYIGRLNSISWNEGTIDLSSLPWGTYRISHQITVNGYTQREELKCYDNIPTKTVGGYSYQFLKYNSNSVKLSKQVK